MFEPNAGLIVVVLTLVVIVPLFIFVLVPVLIGLTVALIRQDVYLKRAMGYGLLIGLCTFALCVVWLGVENLLRVPGNPLGFDIPEDLSLFLAWGPLAVIVVSGWSAVVVVVGKYKDLRLRR